ncbi:MAG: hypothetical protein ACLQKK_18240 [Rhodomicrobium sp.]
MELAMHLKGLADKVKRHQERSPRNQARHPKQRRATRSLRRPAEEGAEIARAAVAEFAKRLKK